MLFMMDFASAKAFRDLTLEVLVLSLHGLQVIQRFLVGVLQFEEFSAQRPCLLLGALQLTLRLLKLLLPL
jgi:hypothetical protein